MAFSLARAAGAGLRRTATPVVVSSSASSIFGKISYRSSSRLSDAPLQKTADHFDGWTAQELTWARGIIDSKLEKKGLVVINTGRDAQTKSMLRTVSKQLPLLQTDISQIKNKKGDVTAIKIGKSGTVNALLVVMLLLTVEEVCPMVPSIQTWIEKLLR